jgi:hypothetical protein
VVFTVLAARLIKQTGSHQRAEAWVKAVKGFVSSCPKGGLAILDTVEYTNIIISLEFAILPSSVNIASPPRLNIRHFAQTRIPGHLAH